MSETCLVSHLHHSPALARLPKVAGTGTGVVGMQNVLKEITNNSDFSLIADHRCIRIRSGARAAQITRTRRPSRTTLAR